MRHTLDLPVTDWEYAEFDIPDEDCERVFLNWLREGWELVGVHPKGKGQRKPLPVAIMRRELVAPPNDR
jgi:hypothetical protein